MTVMLVQPHELHTPKLNLAARSLLLTCLNTVIIGAGTVFCAVSYDKQTKTKPRKAGEDYVKMPGVSPKAQFGEITSVFRTQKGALRFRVRSASRANGIEPTGWTTMIPAGLTEFVVTGMAPTPRPFPTMADLPQAPPQLPTRV